MPEEATSQAAPQAAQGLRLFSAGGMAVVFMVTVAVGVGVFAGTQYLDGDGSGGGDGERRVVGLGQQVVVDMTLTMQVIPGAADRYTIRTSIAVEFDPELDDATVAQYRERSGLWLQDLADTILKSKIIPEHGVDGLESETAKDAFREELLRALQGPESRFPQGAVRSVIIKPISVFSR